jgi:putative ABC transport system permease protein
MSAKRNNFTDPPHFPEWIIRRLAWGEDRSSILEDLREDYLYIRETKGEGSAVFWYWGHMMRSILPFVKLLVYWRFVMFRNYLKLVLRNISKYKGYSFINISGLAVGLACFILISLWIGFEVSYDRFHENCIDLYQVYGENQLPNGDIHFFPQTPAALAQALKSDRSEIRHISRSLEWMEFLLGTEDERFLERVRFVDPDFLEMFSLEFLRGNPEKALSDPHSIILTENIAEKHFLDQDALGKEIIMGSSGSYLVTGIIKEMPANSFLDSLCLLPMEALRDMNFDIDRWSGGNFHTYVHLEERTDLEFFKTQIRDFYKKYAPNWALTKLRLRPITQIHLFALNGGGPILYVYIFSGLSIFILLLAMVNFTNLSIARSFLRAKEIGVRKTVGAFKKQLAKQILTESILVTFFSGCFAIGIAYFSLPVLNQLTGARIDFNFDGKTALFLAGVVILTGVISGVHPAFILSSMNPVRAIRGGTKPGKNSLLFRKILIAFQFSLSIFMIIVMISVNKQLKFLKTKDLGFNQSNILSMGLDQEISRHFLTIQTELMRNPEVIAVTRCSSNMRTESTTTGADAVSWEGNASNIVMPKTHLMRADPQFMETFQIDMVEGRFFSDEFPSDVAESAVINETARKTMDLQSPIDKRLTVWGRDFRIIGVVEDFHFYSLHEEIRPLIFIHSYAGYQNIFIRIDSQNIPKTLRFIQDKIKAIVPGYVPNLKFLDENLQNAYIAEQRMVTGTRYFTLLAILISCIGLLGLASFSVRQRTKEIAVRKVLGASEGNIVLQLFRETLICVVAANIIVFPIAYIVLHRWLQNYAYHTTLGIGIFIFASILTVALAFLSVGWNVLKASLANPVESLRYE